LLKDGVNRGTTLVEAQGPHSAATSRMRAERARPDLGGLNRPALARD